MKRITKRWGADQPRIAGRAICTFAGCPSEGGCDICNHARVNNHLAAIEDILGDEYDLDRLRELAEADREGRCMIVPVKSGQSVYCLQDYFNETTLKSEKQVKCRTVDFVLAGAKMFETEGFIWRFSEIGEKIFLTREEAEAALATDC